jgi:hypothetical protein
MQIRRRRLEMALDLVPREDVSDAFIPVRFAVVGREFKPDARRFGSEVGVTRQCVVEDEAV